MFDENINWQMNEEFRQYIFYERTKYGEYDIFCTRCKSKATVMFSEMCPDGMPLKHRDPAVCPKCRHEGIMFHRSRGKKCLTQRKYFIIWQAETENEVTAYAVRAAKAYNGDPFCDFLSKNYHDDDWTPDPEIITDVRAIYHFTPGDVSIEKDGYYQGWHALRSKCSEPFGTSGYAPAPEYTFINEDVLYNTFMRYSSYQLYLDKLQEYWINEHSWCPFAHLMSYMCLYALLPNLEMMLKCGMFEYVKNAVEYRQFDRRHFNWHASNPKYFFKKLTADEARIVLRSDLSPKNVVEYADLKKDGVKITISQFIDVLKALKHDSYGQYLWEILKKYNSITFSRAWHYINRNNNIHENLIQWRDYLNEADKLGYDMTDERILFPKNIIESHAKTMQLLRAKKNQALNKEMQKLTKKYQHRYSFEFGNLFIKIPESVQEIIDEGQVLSHCVAGYADRHAKGQCIIVFLRKKEAPDVPYYTIEIGGDLGKGQYILQCHGYANERYNKKSAAVAAFELEFNEFLKNPMLYRKSKKTAEKSA